jgi:hypothetical protein
VVFAFTVALAFAVPLAFARVALASVAFTLPDVAFAPTSVVASWLSSTSAASAAFAASPSRPVVPASAPGQPAAVSAAGLDMCRLVEHKANNENVARLEVERAATGSVCVRTLGGDPVAFHDVEDEIPRLRCGVYREDTEHEWDAVTGVCDSTDDFRAKFEHQLADASCKGFLDHEEFTLSGRDWLICRNDVQVEGAREAIPPEVVG